MEELAKFSYLKSMDRLGQNDYVKLKDKFSFYKLTRITIPELKFRRFLQLVNKLKACKDKEVL